MRFNIFAGLLALSGSLAVHAAPAPGSQVVRAGGTLPVGNALALVNSLTTTVVQYEKSINSTLASVNSQSSAEQKAAAAATVNDLLSNIIQAVTKTIASISVQVGGGSGSSTPGTVTDLVSAIVKLISGLLFTCNGVVSVLDVSSVLSTVTSLLGSVTGLLSVVTSVVPGLLSALQPTLSSLLSTVSTLLGGVTSLLGGVGGLIGGLVL